MEINNGFFSLPPEERAEAYERAKEKYGIDNFWDLTPEERGEVYERATRED